MVRTLSVEFRFLIGADVFAFRCLVLVKRAVANQITVLADEKADVSAFAALLLWATGHVQVVLLSRLSLRKLKDELTE